MTTRFPIWLAAVPGATFLLVFFVAPIFFLFSASFREVDMFNNMLETTTTGNYSKIVTDPLMYNSILESLQMSFEVTAICAVLGYIAAYAIVNTRSRTIKSLMYGIVISPLLTSVIARSFGWIVLLSKNGVVNELLMGTGIIETGLRMIYTAPATSIAVAQILLPFSVLPVVSAFADLNRDMEKASAMLGASNLRTFFRIVLPLTAPAVFTGAVLVFVHAMGIYITPLVVGGVSRPLASIRIYDQILTYFNIPQGAALSFVLLLVTAITVALATVVFRTWSGRRLG
jgi:putative spermidine/putrescine transport system permease protein